MKFVVSTVVRNTPKSRPTSGRLFLCDFIEKSILKVQDIPAPLFPSSDDNPRGGVRGGRGIGVHNDFVYVASYDAIHIYDLQLQYCRSISHPLFAGIHEILVEDDGVWVTSTWLDLLLKVDFDGGVLHTWYYRNDEDLCAKLELPCNAVLEYSHDYRSDLKGGLPSLKMVHLNSIRKMGDDEYILTFGMCKNGTEQYDVPQFHAVRYNVVSGMATILFSHHVNFPAHNAEMLNDSKLIFNDSQAMYVVVADILKNEIQKEVSVPGTWLRGLVAYDVNAVFVGSAPAVVYQIDLERGTIVNECVLSTGLNEAVHGMAIIE